MIKVNETVIQQEQFGDGTLKMEQLLYEEIYNRDLFEIAWAYDSDSELFALWCIVQSIRNFDAHKKINLYLPYIPNARQDRDVGDRVFTLKYFAKLINLMNFERVYVADPHSDVAMALIDHAFIDEEASVHRINWDLERGKNVQIMFPDNGAEKKYRERYKYWLEGLDEYSKGGEYGNKPFIIGSKHRNKEGRIASYEVSGLLPDTEKVLIFDDICSYGGTFVAAAKKLKELGVKKVILVVTHCENNILKGEVFDYIDEVYTTDSICTAKHPKLYVAKMWRD